MVFGVRPLLNQESIFIEDKYRDGEMGDVVAVSLQFFNRIILLVRQILNGDYFFVQSDVI
jgi:hypothetical protein